jgi:isopenicillin N synthase-like dioxygenase
MYRTLCTTVSPAISTIAADSPEAPSYTNLTLGFSLEEPGAFLVPEHADSGLITLLYYDLPSLEILDPAAGNWEVVQPRPGLQACYIGKHFAKASGGRFKAAAHRVVNPETGWTLITYLLHPGLDQVNDPNYSR